MGMKRWWRFSAAPLRGKTARRPHGVRALLVLCDELGLDPRRFFVAMGSNNSEEEMIVPNESMTVAGLQAQRQRLALDVEENKSGAAQALAEVEAQLATLKREGERGELAGRERAERDAREAQRERTERRRALEQELAALKAKRAPLARAVDEAAVVLANRAEELLAIGARMYVISAELEGPRARLTLKEAVDGSLRWALGGVMQVARPVVFYRQKLTTILGVSVKDA